MSKIKLEELRKSLYETIDNAGYVPWYVSCNQWTPDQYQELDKFKMALQQQSSMQLKMVVDQILNAVYLQEDMEKDLNLT